MESFSRWAASLGFAYKPAKFLKASAGYAYIYDRNPQESKKNYGNNSGRFNGYNVDHGFWRSKHRFYADLTGKLAIGRLTLSLRERYQMTRSLATSCKRTRFRDLKQEGYTGKVYPWDGYEFMTCEVVENDKKAKTAHYLRSRIEADYNIRNCPLTPYVSFEWSNNLSNDLVLDKTRLTVGGDWKLSKKHKISAAYIYQTGQTMTATTISTSSAWAISSRSEQDEKEGRRVHIYNTLLLLPFSKNMLLRAYPNKKGQGKPAPVESSLPSTKSN